MDIPSNERYVAGILLAVKASILERCGKDCTDLLLVLRELLVNAIMHGNRADHERRVTASVFNLGEGRYALEVEDEGKGFDYRSLIMEPSGDPQHMTHRGYVLIKMLSEEIRFSEEGNRVTVVVSLADGGWKNEKPRTTEAGSWVEKQFSS